MKTTFCCTLVAVSALATAAPVASFDVADRAVTGDVTVVSVPWRFPGGRIDWLFDPTAQRGPFNPEWTWQLNRMHFWSAMADAYRTTRDEKYARAFARQLADWLAQTGGVPPDASFNVVGSPWRTIEEGLRLAGSWHEAWEAFGSSPAFDAALQARFRAAARAQARHLMQHPSPRGNWLLIEMGGLYAYATDFPDDPEAPAMRRFAAKRLTDAVREQILPDGMQYELSPDYHSVAVHFAANLYRRACDGGFAGELPSDFPPLLEQMAEAVLFLTTPSFVQPRFNDCFTMSGVRLVALVAPFFPARDDFAWIVSRRAAGHAPSGATASRFLPWAGFAAMRSDWGPDATYLCFDVGPLGMAHWHQDKLSFTLWKGGEELVFDDGGGQYEISDERTYGRSGHDHNTLLVDGLAQMRDEPRRATQPIDAGWTTTASRDFAFGVYDQGFGPDRLRLATQRREISFEKSSGVFEVTDTVDSADGRDHVYELLFQLDTTNTVVSADGRRLRAHYGRTWDLEIEVREGGTIETAVGQRTPRMAGWFIGRNDLVNHPATTVFVRSPSCRSRRFVTVLKPVKGK